MRARHSTIRRQVISEWSQQWQAAQRGGAEYVVSLYKTTAAAAATVAAATTACGCKGMSDTAPRSSIAGRRSSLWRSGTYIVPPRPSERSFVCSSISSRRLGRRYVSAPPNICVFLAETTFNAVWTQTGGELDRLETSAYIHDIEFKV